MSFDGEQRLTAAPIWTGRLAVAAGPSLLVVARDRRLATQRCDLRVNRLHDGPPQRIHGTVDVVRRLGQCRREFAVQPRDGGREEVVSVLEVEVHGSLREPARGGNFLDPYVLAASCQDEVAGDGEDLIAKS